MSPARPIAVLLVLLSVTGCRTARWRPASLEIGTAAPSRLLASSPDGRWVVLCQGREDTDRNGSLRIAFDAEGQGSGDAFVPYLIEGSGPGARVEAYVGSDPTGQFIALVRRDHLVVRDMVAGRDLDLTARGAVLPPSATPSRPQSAVVFDHSGRRALYFRAHAEGIQPVLLELSSGREKPLATGNGVLGAADFGANDHWIREQFVERDYNGDGRLTWPRTLEDVRSTPCAPVPGTPDFSTRDLIAERWRSLDDDSVVVRDAVGTSRDQVLASRLEGLVGIDPFGKTVLRAPGACGPTWRFSADAYDAIGVTCGLQGNRLIVVEGTRVIETGLNVLAPSPIRAATLGASRLWVVHAANHPQSVTEFWVPPWWGPVALLDLEAPHFDWETNLALIAEGKRFAVVHGLMGTHLIEMGGHDLWLTEVAGKAVTFRMPGKDIARITPEPASVRLRASPWFVVDRDLVNLDSGALRELPQKGVDVLAVDRNGRILRAAAVGPGALYLGPLRWEEPDSSVRTRAR